MWTTDETEPTPAQRSPSGALMALAEARRRLTDGVTPVATTSVSLGEAIRATLAYDVAASGDVPPRTIALRDGWAVAAEVVAGASAHAPVLLGGRPVWVEAGDALPPGTDTVLGPEAVPEPDAPPGRIAVVDEAAETEGTRAAGADLARGAILATAGTRMTAVHVMTFSACRITQVEVRRPNVRLVATGPAGAVTCATLAALVTADGGTTQTVRAASDAGDIADAILAEPADVVFVVGGTGFGRHDRSAVGLALAGAVTAHGVALRPGESTGFGVAGGLPVLLVPGRLDAAIAAYLALGRPLLAALAGAAVTERTSARLLRKVVSTLGMDDLVFVRRGLDGIDPLGGSELPLRRLALADAAVLVPPEREGYAEGTMLKIIPL